MKKLIKLLIGAGVLLIAAGGVQTGIKYYLQGPARPFNALIISGGMENVNQAKAIYKDNTKYTKDYRYKMVINKEKVLDENGKAVLIDGVEEVYENKFFVITKDTARAMLNDQLLRVRKEQDPQSGSIETEILESIEDIDGNKSIFLGNPQMMRAIEINGTKVDLEQGKQSWIGYYPDAGSLVITDEHTYNAIKEEDITISLIRFAEGTKDLRNAEDKAEPTQKLSQVQNIDIDYVNTQE
ncbi:MAG: lipoprotein BA_5634 family protein [Cellulosilyticaceae bacterium]